MFLILTLSFADIVFGNRILNLIFKSPNVLGSFGFGIPNSGYVISVSGLITAGATTWIFFPFRCVYTKSVPHSASFSEISFL